MGVSLSLSLFSVRGVPKIPKVCHMIFWQIGTKNDDDDDYYWKPTVLRIQTPPLYHVNGPFYKQLWQSLDHNM